MRSANEINAPIDEAEADIMVDLPIPLKRELESVPPLNANILAKHHGSRVNTLGGSYGAYSGMDQAK